MSDLLLKDVSRFLRRFIVMSDHQGVAVTLWVAHTHAFEAADVTPYLTVTSALKRSGKSRLLEVLKLLVREPLPTANISDAALFRAIERRQADAAVRRDRRDLRPEGARPRGPARDAERRLPAWRRGAPDGRRQQHDLQTFPVFCPKVFAGIGDPSRHDRRPGDPDPP